jgi:hypothetical protein
MAIPRPVQQMHLANARQGSGRVKMTDMVIDEMHYGSQSAENIRLFAEGGYQVQAIDIQIVPAQPIPRESANQDQQHGAVL